MNATHISPALVSDKSKHAHPKCSFLFIIVLSTITGLLPIQSTVAQINPDETFSLNLQNVDISTLIETVSTHTGKNFIVDPRVKATVNVVSPEPVNVEKLYELFLSVLQVHGFAAVQAGQFTKIVPSTAGVQSAVPLLDESTEAEDEIVSHIISLENIPASQVVETLRPLLPDSASVSAESTVNSIVITDRAANIEKLIELITLMDGQ